VTRRIADHALRVMLAIKEQKPLPAIEPTQPVGRDLARRIEGRYANGKHGVELAERDGKLYLTADEDGERTEVRLDGETLIVDDLLAYGRRIEIRGDELRIGRERFTRFPNVRPDPAPDRWLGLIGEYGWDHNTLYILEKRGKLHALIEWFFSYP